MPSLFERPYRAAATTELERSVREIEDRNEKAQAKESFDEMASNVNSNINFAKRLNLISAEQAEAYMERVERAKEEHERMQREQKEETLRNSENPGEYSNQHMSMKEVQTRINRERANENAQPSESQPSQAHTKDENDGARTH